MRVLASRCLEEASYSHSFPRSAWQCRPGRSASSYVAGSATQNVVAQLLRAIEAEMEQIDREERAEALKRRR
jgi:hypothetical protein